MSESVVSWFKYYHKTNKEQYFELHPSLAKDIESYINRNKLVEEEYL